jgi:hypothetical protein
MVELEKMLNQADKAWLDQQMENKSQVGISI